MDSSSTARQPDATVESHVRHALASVFRLVVVLVPMSLIVAGLAGATGRAETWTPVALAAALCLLGGVAAAVLARPRPGRVEVAKAHLAIGVRTGIPLGGLLVVQLMNPALIEAGLPLVLIPLYAATLVVETWAMLRVLKAQARNRQAEPPRAMRNTYIPPSGA